MINYKLSWQLVGCQVISCAQRDIENIRTLLEYYAH